MKEKIIKAKKILVIGEAGRGKTTLAKMLSDKLNLPIHSTDDFLWKKKFTERHDRQESIKKIELIYITDKWVVEGSSSHLFQSALDKADIIIQLKWNNIFSQWIALIKRKTTRDYESITDLFQMLVYTTRKRFGLGNNKVKMNKELLKPHQHKIIILKSYKDIDGLINQL